MLARDAVVAEHVLDEAGVAGDDAADVRPLHLLGQARRLGDAAAGAVGAADLRGVDRLGGEGEGEAAGLAQAQREQELERAERGAAHGVAQAERHQRPAHVEAGQLLGGQLVGAALGEAEAAQAHARAPVDHRGQHAARRGRQAHADLGEEDAGLLDAAIDVAGAQELLGGAPLEIDALGRRRVDGGREVGVGRGRAVAGVGQRVAELHAQLAGLLGAGAELERGAVQARGAAEGEVGGGLLGGAHRVQQRAVGIAGAAPVDREGLGVGLLRGLEGDGQPAVEVGAARGGERAGHRLAHPIVDRLDGIDRAGAAGAHQVGDAELVGPLHEVVGLELRGQRDGLLGQGRAGQGHQLDDGARRLVEAADAGADRVVDARQGWLVAARGDVADQLVDEHRVPGRLAGQVARVDRGQAAVALDQAEHELLGVVGRQHRQPQVVAGRAGRDGLVELGEGDLAHVAVAQGGEQEQRRRRRRAEQLAEELHAVGVGPVEIVDDQHDRVAQRDPAQELAQRGEGGRADLLRRALVLGGGGGGLDRGQDAHDREDPGQRAGVGREQRGLLLGGQGAEEASQLVDDAVEGLVRHALALVAATDQHHRAGLAGEELVGELTDEVALAHARLAAHQHGDRGAGLDLGHGRRQPGELVAPADERLARRRRAARPRLAQAAQDLVAVGPAGRIAAQELLAELIEIARHVDGDVGRRRPVALLGVEQGQPGRGHEGLPAGQGLEHEDAGGVPVAGLADRAGGEQLGRHVAERAGELRLPAALALHVEGEAEVEHDHPAVGGDEHVRRLDVAVDLARRVQRVERVGQLDERVAQAALVVAAGARGRRGDGAVAGAVQVGDGAGARRVGAAVRPPDERQEVDALHQLHGEEPVVLILDQLAEGDEVGVGDVLERAELVLEGEQLLRAHGAQGLERDPRVALAIDRLVDHAHAAGAEATDDLETAGPLEVGELRLGAIDHGLT